LKLYDSIRPPRSADQTELIPKPKVKNRPNNASLWDGVETIVMCACRRLPIENVVMPRRKR
jgi:hypothetical protein